LRMLVDEQNFKHGGAARGRTTPEYRAWNAMNQHCTNPRDRLYPTYGARGIRVCDQWRHSFEQFLKDIGERPAANLVLNLIDKDKGYGPGNVQWATRTVQHSNRRNNILICIDGETKCLAEWARIFEKNPRTIYRRIIRGWEPKRAVLEPT